MNQQQAKIVLITGLDGSGKSTFFERITPEISQQQGIIRLPFFEIESLPQKVALRNVCAKINAVNQTADEQQQPTLKIIALFASMLLFKNIVSAFEEEGKKLIITERHPLVDAAIYAGSYRAYFGKESTVGDYAPSFDQHLEETIGEVLTLAGKRLSDRSPITQLFQEVRTLFSEKYDPEKASAYFGIKPPDQAYFLDAPTKILFERIAKRSLKEHHETEEKLHNMRTAYLNYFNGNDHYTIIDGSDFSELDQFTDSFRRSIKC